MKGVVFTTDGKMFVKEFTRPLYKSVSDVVEGWIEVVHPRGLEDPFCFICNEEGLLRDLPLNAMGSLWYGTLQHGQPIVGNIVVMKEGITEEGPRHCRSDAGGNQEDQGQGNSCFLWSDRGSG